MATSSGDESDDADLTDGDSSEDVWSDIDGLIQFFVCFRDIYPIYRIISRTRGRISLVFLLANSATLFLSDF